MAWTPSPAAIAFVNAAKSKQSAPAPTVKGAGPGVVTTPAPAAKPGGYVPSAAALAYVASHAAPGQFDNLAYSPPAAGFPGALPGVAPDAAIGIDIAQVNETWNPEGAQYKPGFAIFKVSEGLAPYDFSKFYQAAQTSGTPLLGAYHFMRPEYSTSGQVKNFLAQTSGYNFGFYAVDLEDSPIHRVTPALADQARSFMQQVNQATGKPVLLYTNESTLTKFFNRPTDRNIPLWISDPDPTPSPNSAGRPWVLWQYAYNAPAHKWGTKTSNVNIYSQGVDVNRAHGNVTTLIAQLQAIGANQNQYFGGP